MANFDFRDMLGGANVELDPADPAGAEALSAAAAHKAAGQLSATLAVLALSNRVAPSMVIAALIIGLLGPNSPLEVERRKHGIGFFRDLIEKLEGVQ